MKIGSDTGSEHTFHEKAHQSTTKEVNGSHKSGLLIIIASETLWSEIEEIWRKLKKINQCPWISLESPSQE